MNSNVKVALIKVDRPAFRLSSSMHLGLIRQYSVHHYHLRPGTLQVCRYSCWMAHSIGSMQDAAESDSYSREWRPALEGDSIGYQARVAQTPYLHLARSCVRDGIPRDPSYV